jgi:hypothetical protein
MLMIVILILEIKEKKIMMGNKLKVHSFLYRIIDKCLFFFIILFLKIMNDRFFLFFIIYKILNFFFI